MARRFGKKKMPRREEKPLVAVSKISGRVFDDKTLEVIGYLRNNKIITSLDYPIAEGKEAVVFKGTSVNGEVAVKIFKYETSSFLKRSMLKYMQGDPRFTSLKMNHRQLVKLWARKEFANLKACQEAGVAAPRPIKLRENVIVMEFLGENSIPHSLLKDCPLEENEIEKIYEQIVENMVKLWRNGFVHADLNEFNIMTDGQKMWFIDLAQAVRKEHPLALEFLQKDCENIAKFFAKKGVETSKEEILSAVFGS